jgi:hypothetical protein
MTVVRVQGAPTQVFTDDLRSRCQRLCEAGIRGSGSSFEARLRLVLLTPAVFSANLIGLAPHRADWVEAPAWRPFWLQTTPQPMPWLPAGSTIQLEAAIVGRPTAVGFWDSDSHAGAGSNGPGGPRPMYRAAPAGSVYHLRLQGSSEDLVRRAIHRLFDLFWFRTIHIGRQADRDTRVKSFFGRTGFGTTVIGASDAQ